MSYRIIYITAVMLISCTGQPVAYKELDLVKGQPNYLMLTSMYGFINNTGINKGKWSIFLSQGQYVARYRNNRGVFFQGPSRCARWVQRGGKKKEEKVYNCGLFRPKGEAKKLYLYTFKSKLSEVGFREYQESKYFIHKDDLGESIYQYLKEGE